MFVVSMSGGKDSTAVCLALREANVPARYVFADTGWEASETYDHLGVLERVLGITIDRVGVEGGMRARMRTRAGFASRMQRWCTRELKVEPIQAYQNAIDDEVVSVVGIRAEESAARAKFPVFGFDDQWGGFVWRPILLWTVAEVLAIHHRHGVPVNPLYQKGFSRVGCWPCGPFASKEDIRLWAEHAPDAVAEVRALEAEMSALRQVRNVETPGRYTYPDDATFFQTRYRTADVEGGRAYTPMGVDATVTWSRTARGGVQLKLLPDPPDTGCFRWGMCEPPTPEE